MTLRGGSPVAADAPSYVDEPDSQLKKMVPGLSGIKFEAEEKIDDKGAAEVAQENTALILSKTGAVVAGLLKKMPDLIAREDVKQPAGPQAMSAGLSGNRNSAAISTHGLNGFSAPKYEIHSFTYRIVHGRSASGDDVLEESRTDTHDRQIDSLAQKPLSIGFATVWLFFLPSNLHDSNFRYLGQQRIDGRKTYVLAFAQIRSQAGQNAMMIQSSYGPCSSPLEGVAWIDQSTFEIVRVQTDFLSPLPGIGINRIRAVLSYGGFAIHGLGLRLWLPKGVETSWQTIYGDEAETHLYSGYRLFTSTARILPAPNSAPQ